MISVNWHPERSDLRWFGVACVVVFGALGAAAFAWRTLFGFGLSEPVSVQVAAACWVVAASSGVLAVAAPSALRPFYRALTAVSLPIGYVVSRAIMALVYFGIVTPIALVFRLAGRDALARRRDPARRSYWEPRAAAGDIKRYYRQF
jgi:hypothetical protein